MSLLSFAPRAFALVILTALMATPPRAAEAPDSPPPLVSVEWLKEKLTAPDLVVLDVRSAINGGSVEAYEKAHIPGAVHSDYDKGGWRVTRNGVPFMVPTLAELEKLIGETGIDEDSHVVVTPAGVHASDFGAAARVYWTLKHVGVAKVSILDGGFAAWARDASNPLETGRSAPSPKIFTAKLNNAILADAAAVEQVHADKSATLVDARPATFFSGKEKAPRAEAYGHIPGAVNIDSAAFYDPASNRLRPKEELERIAAPIPAGPAVAYCNTGHWAATDWFVLSEILGRKDARLYAGSMVDWTSDGRRPIASQRTKWDDLMKALGRGS